MADPFTWGNGGQQITSDQQRMALAQALLQQGQQQPANNWAQGASNALAAFAGGYYGQQIHNQSMQNNTSVNPFAGSGTDASNPQVAQDNLGSALLRPAAQVGGLLQQNPFAGGGISAGG